VQEIQTRAKQHFQPADYTAGRPQHPGDEPCRQFALQDFLGQPGLAAKRLPRANEQDHKPEHRRKARQRDSREKQQSNEQQQKVKSPALRSRQDPGEAGRASGELLRQIAQFLGEPGSRCPGNWHRLK